MSKKYDYLFFDLDNTFWSVDQNQICALRDVHYTFAMDRYFESFEDFYNRFIEINTQLWLDYRDDKINRFQLRNDRFSMLLKQVGVNDLPMSLRMSDEYLRVTPTHTNLIDGSVEILEYLYNKGYKMSLVTNGFNEVQFSKVEKSGLEKYFEHIITSELAGCNKPAIGIFEYALNKLGLQKEQVIMIGDDPYNDVWGAEQAGLDSIYLNEAKAAHELSPTYEVHHLLEIKDIL